MAIGLFVGTALGVVAGSVGGWVDHAIMRLVDVLLSIPVLLLSLSIIILLGFGTVNAAIAVGFTSIASFARLVRSEVVSVRRRRICRSRVRQRRHILQGPLAPCPAKLADISNRLHRASGRLRYSSALPPRLSRLRAPPPTPEWGLLIAEGRNYIATAWWLTAAPGIVVVLVVPSVNRASQAIGRAQR